MIRLSPVEAAAVDDQKFFVAQQIESKFFVVCDIELFRVNFREHVERSFWFDCGDTRNIAECFVNVFTLLVNSSARNDVVVDTLVAAKSGLDNGLCRNIGAETHVGEHFEPFNIIFCDPFVAA